MNNPAPDPAAPRRILLATDMSARGDRALERALAISRSLDAHLLIVHVFEELDESSMRYGRQASPSWRRPPDAVQVMKQRIRQGLQDELGDSVEKATVFMEEGEPSEVIERVAEAERADLIVTGIAREGLFAARPVIIGRTVEQLLRRTPVPILIVRNRPRGDYRHVVVATDLSEPSAHALQMALRFFPERSLYLLHASAAPYATLAPDTAKHAERFVEVHAAEMDAFLESIFMPAGDRKRLIPVIEPGVPQQLIREYVQMRGADLVVLGTHGRGGVLEALLGSTAKSILSTLPCDALVVRGPRR